MEREAAIDFEELQDEMLEKRQVPAALLDYAAAQISSGCQCLNLKPKTMILTTRVAPVQVRYSSWEFVTYDP